MASASYHQPPPPDQGGKDPCDEENNKLLVQEQFQLNETIPPAPQYEMFSDSHPTRGTPFQISVDNTHPTFPQQQQQQQQQDDLPIGQKRALFIWLILSTIIDGILFLASLAMCLMSVMFFDAGVTVGALIAVGIVFCIPVLIIGAIRTSWKAYNRGNYTLVIWLNTPPSLIVIVCMLSSMAAS